MATTWRGVFPAITAKMKPDGQVDLEATLESLDRLVEKGVAGVIVLRMLGENTPLTVTDLSIELGSAEAARLGSRQTRPPSRP